MPLKGPASTELTQNFDEVRRWIAQLDRQAKHYRIVWRHVNHRVLGANDLPSEVWIDTLDDALALVDRRREAERFTALVAMTQERLPDLEPWLRKRPLRALALAHDWPRLLDIVTWMRRHPRPGLYLRQVDIPGVHSKFIEGHRSVLMELFDRVLPEEVVDRESGGVSGFGRRYGFRDKPVRVRFRILDDALAIFPTGTDQDIAVTQETFAGLDLPVDTVFFTENEINFLAFPRAAGSMVIFRRGLRVRHVRPGPLAARPAPVLLGRHRHPRVCHPRSACAAFSRTPARFSWTVRPSWPTRISGGASRARKSGIFHGWIPRKKQCTTISATTDWATNCGSNRNGWDSIGSKTGWRI